MGEKVFFVADDIDHGVELWVTDGTPAGTSIVKNIFEFSSSYAQDLVELDGLLYFFAEGGPNGSGLWRSDGTEAGTVLVSNIPRLVSSIWPTSHRLVQVAGRLCFTQWGGSELWISDGTASGTQMIDIWPGPLVSNPSFLTPVGDTLYFIADDGEHGDELWKATFDAAPTAPAVGAITAPLDPRQVNTTVNVSANFTDAGTLDTHTATWDWGDSSTSAGDVSETNGSGGVTGSHAYAAAGVYTVTLTVTDDDGDSSQSVFEYVVVYNPTGGFVTGGGTFHSPAGALAGDPTASGMANFAFVSKYQHGANVPVGETRFRFNVGDFVFESESYDWMVISGAKARYRGVGNVNGASGYGFQITVIDGDRPGGGGVDRFRIKIWSLSAGNPVVYDNQLAAPDDEDPLTAILGGSIRIQI